MDKKIVVEFRDLEPKKNSIRFNCTDPKPAITSVYISKEALKKLEYPEKIKVTVEPLD